MAQWWAGSECTVVLEKPEDYDLIGKEHNITIMNHKYDIDWLMAWILAERFQMLGVSNKAILLRETICKFCQGMSDIFFSFLFFLLACYESAISSIFGGTQKLMWGVWWTKFRILWKLDCYNSGM